MTKLTPQGTKQRVGRLVEEHVCIKHKLKFNQRQQTKGYYDAYNKDHIFEIKAVKTINAQDPRLIIIIKNHKELLNSGRGKYIIVNYELINKDKDLQLIQDINILDHTIISAENMSNLISKHGTFFERDFRGRIKKYVRIKYSYVKNNGNKKSTD